MVFEIIFPDPLLKVELRLALATYDVECLRKIKKLENVKVNLTLQQLKNNPSLILLALRVQTVFSIIERIKVVINKTILVVIVVSTKSVVTSSCKSLKSSCNSLSLEICGGQIPMKQSEHLLTIKSMHMSY